MILVSNLVLFACKRHGLVITTLPPLYSSTVTIALQKGNTSKMVD